MAANMYDQAALALFLNTYAPINFGELYRIGAAQKQSVDEAAKLFGAQLQKFGEFQSPSQVDTQRYFDLTVGRQDMQDAINQMVTNPDALKDAAFRSNLQSLINSTDYAALSNLKQSRDAMLQRQLLDLKLMLENRYNPMWHGVDYGNYDTLGSKIFDDITPLPYMSVRELVEPYVNNLKGEFLGANLGFLWNGVTDQMTDDQLRKNISSIQSTPLYLKYIDMYLKQGLSREQAEQKLSTEILTAGREFTWNKADRDPVAIENMRLQAKYAKLSQTDPTNNNMNNLTRVLEMDATRNHLLKFTNLTPQYVDAFAQQGFEALYPNQIESVRKAMNPEYIRELVFQQFTNTLSRTKKYSTATNSVIDMLSTPISFEASNTYAPYGTTGKQDREGFYTANSSSNFKLAAEFVNDAMGVKRKGLQKFISLWNEGNNFTHFKISPDQREVSDGKNIYLVKHAYVSEDQLKNVGMTDDELKEIGTKVTIDNGPRTTERLDNRGRVDSTTTTFDTPVKMVKITVLQLLPRVGEAAITADASWSDKDLNVQSKTQDIQVQQSQNENLFNAR